VQAGGAAGQILAKNSATNFDTAWIAGFIGATAGGDLSGTYPSPLVLKASAPGAFAVPGDATKAQVILGNQTAKVRLQSSNTAVVNAYLSTNLDPNAAAQDDVTKPSWQAALFSTMFAVGYGPAGGSVANLLTFTPPGQLTIPGYAAVGSLTDTAQLVVGSTVAKGRLLLETGGRIDLMVNAKLGSAWASDDTSKSSWLLGLDPTMDAVTLFHAIATTGAPAWTAPLAISGAGLVTIPGTVAITSAGDKRILLGVAGQGQGSIDSNASIQLDWNHPWAPDAPTLPSWTIRVASDDQFLVGRRAANAAAGAMTWPLSVTNDGITHCTLAAGSVTRTMIAASHAYYQQSIGNLPASYSLTTTNTWIRLLDVAINTRGGMVLIFCTTGGYMYPNNSGGCTYTGIGLDYAAPGPYSRHDAMANSGVGGVAKMPIPMTALAWLPPAGNHVFSFWMYSTQYAYTPGDAAGQMWCVELS
jgi:hypothetical protein